MLILPALRLRSKGRRCTGGLTLGLVTIFVAACTTLAPQPSLEPHLVPLSEAECLTVLRDDGSRELLSQALTRSEEYLARLPAQRELNAIGTKVTAAELFPVVHAAREALSVGRPLANEICTRFRLHRAELPDGILVTGYYEPEIPASRVRTERFRFPLYRIPDDLISVDLGALCEGCGGRTAYGRVHDYELVPYYTRAEIDSGALAGKDEELVWLDDPIEAFFLHIQGSATLRFDDGSRMQVSYAASNDRAYTSIGRLLVEQGKLTPETASLRGLKKYLRDHPEEQATIMAANERYIFFRTVAAGPIGSIGVPLTAGRSIAADRRVYPPGALVFLRIEEPASKRGPSRTVFARFALVQDAGTAIKGPGRIDAFWGTGAEGESLAGGMRNPGEIFIILPR